MRLFIFFITIIMNLSGQAWSSEWKYVKKIDPIDDVNTSYIVASADVRTGIYPPDWIYISCANEELKARVGRYDEERIFSSKYGYSYDTFVNVTVRLNSERSGIQRLSPNADGNTLIGLPISKRKGRFNFSNMELINLIIRAALEGGTIAIRWPLDDERGSGNYEQDTRPSPPGTITGTAVWRELNQDVVSKFIRECEESLD